MKCVPAVWVGLSGLFTLRVGLVISATGPALSWSFASSKPPGAPRATSDLVTPLEAGAKASRFGKSRPKVCGPVETNALRAGAARTGREHAPAQPARAARTRRPRYR